MKIYKAYVTTPTLCKNGVTMPITRVHLESTCELCFQPMIIEKKFAPVKTKRIINKRPLIRWKCTNTDCNHTETNTNSINI